MNAISPAVYLPDIANLAICIFIKLIGKSILLNISSDSNNIVGAENAIWLHLTKSSLTVNLTISSGCDFKSDMIYNRPAENFALLIGKQLHY